MTQRGFPEGRLYAQSPTQEGQLPSQEDNASPVADPARFNTLAILYAELATSDPVRRLMSGGRPIRAASSPRRSGTTSLECSFP